MKHTKVLFFWICVLIVIFGVIIGSFFFKLHHYFSIETLRLNSDELHQMVSNNPIESALIYTASYSIAVLFSLPLGFFFGVTAGFLFSQPFATIFACIGEIIGATLCFLAADTVFGRYFKKKTNSFLGTLEKGFQENETQYLIMLRLLPIFPHWIVNMGPAFLGVKLWKFVWTTSIGIIPVTFAYTQTGKAIDILIESSIPLSQVILEDRNVLLAFVALGLFVFIPTIVKYWKKFGKKKPRT